MENIKIIEENNEKDDIIQLTSEMERLWYFENQKKENQINFDGLEFIKVIKDSTYKNIQKKN